MTTIMIGKALATVTENEILTSGMIGAKVRFIFSEEWSGLTKTAIFKASYTTKAVTQDQWDGNSCSIPSEVLSKAGEPLLVGLYGINASKKIAIPTVWATVGAIRNGADPSADASTSDTLPVWAQVQETAENAKETAEAAKELAENAYVKPSGGIPAEDLSTVHYYTNDSFEENTLSILYGLIYHDSNSGSGVADLTYNSLCVKFQNATPFTLRVDDPEKSTSAYLIFDYLGADALYGHFFDSPGMRRFKATTSGITEIPT